MASCLGNGLEMRRDFVVSVTHGGKPLTGVTVLWLLNMEEKRTAANRFPA